MKPILDALLTVAIFWALIGVLLFAPVWARWIDDETDRWERDAADRNASAYAQTLTCRGTDE